MRITVVQRPSRDVRRHLNKTVAELIVAQVLGVWVEPGRTLRVLTLRGLPDAAMRPRPLSRQKYRYIPEKMPPVEVPGVKFEEPQSDTWKRQHRAVDCTQMNSGASSER